MSRVRVWLRRAIILLIAVLMIGGVSVYVLYYQREALSAASSHVRVAAAFTPVKGLSTCWVETGSTFVSFPFAMTAGSIVVKHPAGTLLIDTGNSSHFDEEISGYPFLLRLKLRNLAGQLDPDVPLGQLLRLVGEEPAKIRWVILSHSHLDHAGGLMDLPRLPVLLKEEELRYANDPKVQAKGFVVAAHTARFPAADNPTLKFEPKPYETFDESTDLYGDGSVVVVPLRGHTPGSVGIFVNLDSRKRFFYVGDAVDDERSVEDRSGKPLILRDTDYDRARANEIVAKLNQLQKMVPEITLIPAHGRSAYFKFFPNGPLSCVSADTLR